MEKSVDRGAIRRLLRKAVSLGGEDRSLRKAARLPSVLPERLPLSSLFQLWRAATDTLGYDVAWAVSASVRLDDLGLFGFSVQTAPTADAALTTACRLFELISQGPRPARLDSPTLRIGPGRPTDPGEAETQEAVLAHFVHLSRQAAPALQIRRLYLCRRLGRHDRVLTLGLPVSDGASANAVVFERQTLGARPHFAHDALHAYLRAPTARALGRLDSAPADLVARVATLLQRRLHDAPTVEDTAAELGLAPRTLRRQLATRGTSFRQLRDQIRRQEASRLVRRPELALTEVAEALGYSELSAFSRAYRSWFGCPPTQARRGPTKSSGGR